MSHVHRRPAVAGSFYPADARMLRAELASYLQAVPPPSAGMPAPKLIVVPHAGYVYSAPVAAFAYALLAPWRSRFTRIVLLGPTHRVPVRGLAVAEVDAFETPLGAVPVDRGAVASLLRLPQVSANDAAHAQEHALEVQLPFLQTVLDRFTLVPLAVGRASAAEVAEVIEALWGGDETLIVVSSDLSHYLPYGQARELDANTVQRVLRFDSSIRHDEACGATPLNGALQVARVHGLAPRLLDLRNSGDTAGDRSRVVGYCAMAFEPAAGRRRDAADGAAAATGAADDALGSALLSRARNAIAEALGLPLRPEPAHPALQQPAATFVTLRRHGELRGCVGRLEASRRLDEDVRCNARSAAFGDPRFVALEAHEWHGLQVEVSLLETPVAIDARSQAELLRRLRPGEDGLILGWRGQRTTFLPQVWEQLPDPSDFLAQLKRKAGLKADFWHAELELQRYGVRKFDEAEPAEAAA